MTLLLSSCSRKSPAASGARPAAGVAVPVLVAKAESRNIPVEIHAIGSVQAYSVVSVRSQITGPITDVHFQEGQEVRTGDLLFTIDPRPYEAALNQAKANLIRDEAQLVSARLEFERTSNLFASKIASHQDYDTAEANYRALAGTVLADHAAISNAQVSFGYTAIRAPIDGRTGDLAVKKGNVVKAPDDVLLIITQVRPIYVAFSVPEQNLPAIRRQSNQAALPVEAVVPSQPNTPVRGELTFVNNMVDTNTGTILLKGTFANANNMLWPGQFVEVSLTLSNLLQATVVPSQAVQTGQNGEFVFVVKPDQTVEPHPVSSSVSYDGWTVITSGVQPDETVVTDGQLRLTPGAKVNIKTPPATGSSTSVTTSSKQE
jgi:multidrug efflux system membrane fusion protein